MSQPHFAAFGVIWVGFLVNSVLALAAFRRMEKIKPSAIPTCLGAWAAGLLAALLMSFGRTGTTLLNGLAMSIGALALMVGLVLGLQLLLFTPRSDPPEESDDFALDPGPTPGKAEPLSSPDRTPVGDVVDDFLSTFSHDDALV